jgi:hypothetical protein
MSTHTPGPWWIVSRFVGPLSVVAKVDTTIDKSGMMEVAHVGAETFAIAEANARLISAAPEMLEALEALVNAEALSGVSELVAGWNGPPEKPYSPHPANLGASIKTTCGRVYKLDEAMKTARAAIAKARGTT